MKTLHTLPTDKAFFDNYATLVKSLIAAGIFAQIVSGFTETGAIYLSVKQSLQPLGLAWLADIVAVILAIIAATTIELGLRKALPVFVDSIIYKRFKGLHLPISIFLGVLVSILILASGLLSFYNSKTIVDDFTPEAEQLTTIEADSIQAADLAAIQATYESSLQAATIAADANIQAANRQYYNIKAKEKRTGQSFATSKDAARQKIADSQAEKAATLAELLATYNSSLQDAKNAYNSERKVIQSNHQTATNEVKETNDKAEAERLATVTNYGGGLGWFTVVCLFIFITSVVVDRIYRKGAGIVESVQIEAYDFRPSAFVESFAAIRERVSYTLHSKITAFANNTPAAPLPSQPSSVYDLTEALQHITIKLELDNNTEEEQRTIFLSAKEPEEEAPPPQRKQIGFQQQNSTTTSTGQAPSTNADNSVHTHQNSCAVKPTLENVSLADATQRLKMYKKRLGSHQSKAQAQEKKSGKVCKRTADAISNNREWVNHYESIIKELKNQ